MGIYTGESGVQGSEEGGQGFHSVREGGSEELYLRLSSGLRAYAVWLAKLSGRL